MIGKHWLTILAATLIAGAAHAAVINFESTPPLGGGMPTDDLPLPTLSPYIFPGLLVSFGFDLDSNGTVESNAVFEHAAPDPGEPIGAGFQGYLGAFDVPDPAYASQLGSWFLRGPVSGAPFGRFVIQYSTGLLITAASGEIWDIDGSPTNTESYRVEAFNSSNALLAFQNSPTGASTGPLPSLDAKPWMFSFSGLSGSIDHIVITFTGTKTSGIGLAFNNFNPVAIPEPASATLLTAGAFALLRFRSRPRPAFWT